MIVHPACHPSLKLFDDLFESLAVSFAQCIAMFGKIVRYDHAALFVILSTANNAIGKKSIVLLYLVWQSPVRKVVAFTREDILVVVVVSTIPVLFIPVIVPLTQNLPFIPRLGNRSIRIERRGRGHHLFNAVVPAGPVIVGAVQVVAIFDQLPVRFVLQLEVFNLCRPVVQPAGIPVIVGFAAIALRVCLLQIIPCFQFRPKSNSSVQVKEIDFLRGITCLRGCANYQGNHNGT